MTREEIIKAWKEFDQAAHKRYWDAGCSIDASLDAPLTLAHWVRRATLEEAARAVCQGCREMDYNPLTEDHRRQIDDAGNCEGGPCSAVAIHDLIAALDAKADAGPGGGA